MLENSVDGKTVLTVLQELSQSDKIQLIDIMIIIKNVVPIYPSLPSETRKVILSLVVKSLDFIAQLISFTSCIPKKQSHRRIYERVLKDLLLRRTDCLRDYLGAFTRNRVEIQNIKAVFFGSKLFNALAPDIDIVWYLERLIDQWICVFDMPLDFFSTHNCGQYLVAMLNLHPVITITVLFPELFLLNEHSFKVFRVILNRSSQLDQLMIIKNYLLPYLAMNTNSSNYRSIYVLLKSLPQINVMGAQTILKVKSLTLQQVLIQLQDKNSVEKLVAELMNKFHHLDEMVDENVCQILVLLLQLKMSKNERDALSHDPQFLDAITERLKHQDNMVRERTMFVAKTVTNGELEYESDFTLDVPHLDFVTENELVNDAVLDSIKKDHLTEPVATLPSIVQNLKLREDSDDEDDAPGDGTDREILFLKDLVKTYETADKNTKIDIVPLFKLTTKLVRQKKDLPAEVDFYGTSLISAIATSNNNYEESKFEESRINALVSVISTLPNKVVDLLGILFNRELSLQQRMSILTTLGFSARELKGYDDKAIAKPQYDFPTKRLPWDTGKPSIQDLSPFINDSCLIGPSTTVWKSKKLEPNLRTRTLKKDLFKPYAAKFFYPLAHAWLNGIDLGSYDQLFKTHYLATLTIIYHCAFPAHDYVSMTQLMKQILLDASQQGVQLPPGTKEIIR